MVEETQTEETQTEKVEEVSVIPEYVPEKFWDCLMLIMKKNYWEKMLQQE